VFVAGIHAEAAFAADPMPAQSPSGWPSSSTTALIR
jgi:hypothetical protein